MPRSLRAPRENTFELCGPPSQTLECKCVADLGRKMLKVLLTTVMVAIALLYLAIALPYLVLFLVEGLDGVIEQLVHIAFIGSNWSDQFNPQLRAAGVRGQAIVLCSILLAGPALLYGLWRLRRFADRRLGRRSADTAAVPRK